MHESGWQVMLLLAGAFRGAVDELHTELAQGGHPAARPLHGFALQAIGPDGCTINELGQRLGVSKQAAAKTATVLEGAGYIAREAVPDDRRAVLLRRTPRADDLLEASAAGLERTMARWRSQLGANRFEAMVEALAQVAGEPLVGDLPGWLTRRTPASAGS